ncbi:serine proteinase stubble isoform X2 [Anthonomus grandis grandis]|nr:serine proteinase stubble isoform X2 [Anthonomus grandis grandis]XP_050308488.1 serine proteinase stubble isoform X2 [Anthonomus grandis grandis]XP_050308489.1 serine proteinase stubble isoform X2 [Anthonomus grandis grandis]
MLWMATLGAILVWYSVPTVESASQIRQGYQINPKPCWVDGQEGTCMFVFECINSNGYHIGMCVDAFMFGSCCAHNSTNDNTIASSSSSHRPQILYTAPSHSSSNSHSSQVTKKPVKTSSFSQYSSSQARPTSRPFNSNSSINPKPQILAASMSVRPSYSSRHSTPPPRHSVRPMSTDAFSIMNILAPYTKPEKQPSTEKPHQNAIQTDGKPAAGWQYTTEPSFVTRVKKPTSFKPKPYKPTKKPLPITSKYPTKPVKSTTEKYSSIPYTTTTAGPKSDTETDLPIVTTLSNFLKDQMAHRSDCGVPQLFTKAQTRIVGGKNAVFGRWPWQVSVRRISFFGFSSTHRCGGAILNENWIATAGHCVDDLLTSQIRIRVGEFDFSNAEETLPYAERSVAKKIVHPKYNFFTYEYDLALVQLDKPIEFEAHIRPICLPASDDLLVGENATVTGWGRLSEGGTLPSVLQEVQVPIVSNDRCKSMFLKAGRQEIIPEIFLCAGHEGGGQDSCQGDSGGPLQVKGRDGRYFLAGIISWGIGCAEVNLPGVCTRISKFVPWILKYVT